MRLNFVDGQRPRRTPLMLAGAIAAASLSFHSSALAADRTWISAVNGTYSDPARWSGGVAPVTADNVHFTQPGAYTVTFSTSPSGRGTR